MISARPRVKRESSTAWEKGHEWMNIAAICSRAYQPRRSIATWCQYRRRATLLSACAKKWAAETCQPGIWFPSIRPVPATTQETNRYPKQLCQQINTASSENWIFPRDVSCSYPQQTPKTLSGKILPFLREIPWDFSSNSEPWVGLGSGTVNQTQKNNRGRIVESPGSNKVEIVSYAGKVMASIFCYAKGMQPVDCVDKGQRVSGIHCAEFLRQIKKKNYSVREADKNSALPLGQCSSPQVHSGNDCLAGMLIWIHPTSALFTWFGTLCLLPVPQIEQLRGQHFDSDEDV